MVFKFCLLSKIGTTVRGRISDRPPWSSVGYLILVSTCILLFHGCVVNRDMLAKLPLTVFQPDHVEGNYFLVEKEEDVIGRLAVVRLKWGDTLPDIARHYSLGINTISAANPGVDVWVPRSGEFVVLPVSFILPETRRKGIVINLAAMRLFYYKKDGEQLAVSTFPVGVGTAERPTPMGRMVISRKKVRPTWYVPASIAADHRKKGDPLPASVPPGPLNPLGEYALYLSKAGYLVHGTNKPASIGLRATNGCIRLYPEDIKRLFDTTPVKTPVQIVNQPYLFGWRNGIMYFEAHKPFEETGTAKLKKVYEKLRRIEVSTGHILNWNKIKTVAAEARGLPVAVSARGPGGGTVGTESIRLRHPSKLNGKPQVPDLRTDGWYVLAATMREEVNARRLSAILNHQGPQIPSRVLSKSGRYQVLSGPFNNRGEAKTAKKRMRIDLEIEGTLVPPVEQKIVQSGK